MTPRFDYIVVGGGSAGCVLASRLSEDPTVTVCLIEAGKRDVHPFIHIPAGFAKMTAGPWTWGLHTVPQKHANNRSIVYVQGRVLGGGSSINAEVFTRGHPSDFDRWEQEGATGWAFQDVQKYFLRSEGNSILSGPWHGTTGPLGVSNLVDPNVTTRAFVQSCQERGLPYNCDFNGPQQEGAGPYQLTVRNQKRCSTAVGYLRPALSRKNLTVVTNAFVLRLLFEGRKASGVQYSVGGKVKTVAAEREILVTSGAIGTPKLLMLSGIGPAEHLKQHGIPVVHDLPGVGQNLQDHYGVDIVAELKKNISLDKYNKLHNMAWSGLQYAVFGTGPAASNIVEAGAFWRTSPTIDVPDIQLHFLAGAGAEAGVMTVPKGQAGITLNSYLLRPKSRGTVRLNSADARIAPLVDPNFLSHPDDLRLAAKGVMLSYEIFSQPSLQKHIREICFFNTTKPSLEECEAYVRQYGRTSYHPTCTCRMGSGQDAVVDPFLKVYGMEGLRICDSSAMPSLLGSNTNAATVMIAERAAEFIRA
ncbi:GMC family oxidoreductase [Acetobacter cibinongensis]|uniref:Alanine-phosphoribitol ligase n=1 Tax=Acetobacter cibinongensis TaxID=146475 RepID=A0A1Z5YXC0_9PROT|nr:GMC family oxidoreductase N-terminal domain-containing protein [Acetobacter cibinongensis]OUJ03913.1 alanine-phosphoribitol ligase [Acetobacter cibinongensis]